MTLSEFGTIIESGLRAGTWGNTWELEVRTVFEVEPGEYEIEKVCIVVRDDETVVLRVHYDSTAFFDVAPPEVPELVLSEAEKVATARDLCRSALYNEFGLPSQEFIVRREWECGPKVWRAYVWWGENGRMFMRPWLIKDYNLYTEGGDTSESSSVQ